MITFHQILRGCMAGDADAWRGFLKRYLSVLLRLAKHYFADVAPEAEIVAAMFARTREEDAARWKKFSGTTEDEFLADLRALALAEGRAVRAKADAARVQRPRCTVELLEKAIEPLPYVQRQFVFLGLKGYEPAEIGEIVNVQPAAAAAAVEKAREALAAHLAGGEAGEWLTRQDELLQEFEQQRTADCVPVRTFVRISDGQISWRDKEAAERHIHSCHHCHDALASFHEMKHYFRVLPAADEAQVEREAARLGLAASKTRGASPIARLLDTLRGPRSAR